MLQVVTSSVSSQPGLWKTIRTPRTLITEHRLFNTRLLDVDDIETDWSHKKIEFEGRPRLCPFGRPEHATKKDFFGYAW